MGFNKELIKSRFWLAQESYDRQAQAQQEIAQRLCTLVYQKVGDKKLQNVFEFGCGTGDYTKALTQRLNIEHLDLNDITPISPALKEKIQPVTFVFEQEDAEKKILQKDHYDLITASSSIQWFDNIPAFIKRSYDALKPGGYLAFSTFLPENLFEIRSLTGIGIDYLSLKEWRSILKEYQAEVQQEQPITLHFESPRAVLKHLQATGVNSITSIRWGKTQLQDFTHNYKEQFEIEGKYPLTYQPVYIIIKKQ